MAAGSFSASALQELRIAQEAMFAGGAKSNDEFNFYGSTLLKQIENQTATTSLLNQPGIDQDVVVYWLKSCNDTAATSTVSDECGISAPELESTSKTYTISTRKSFGFTIDREKLRTNHLSLEDQIAKGQLKAKAVLANAMNAGLITYLSAQADTPITGGVGSGTISGSTITFPAAQFTADLYGQLQLIALRHKMQDKYVANGDNFFNLWYASQYAGPGAASNDAAKFNAIDSSWDPISFASASKSASSFMVDNNAVVFASKNRFAAEPVELKLDSGTQTRYQEDSMFLPGVSYDVVYTQSCVGGSIKDTWTYFANYDFFTNPEDCDGNSGILEIVAV